MFSVSLFVYISALSLSLSLSSASKVSCFNDNVLGEFPQIHPQDTVSNV